MLKDHPLTYLFISVLTSFLLKFPWKSSQQMDNGLQMLLGPGCMLRITQDLQKASVFGDCIFPCLTYQTVKLRKALVATHSKSQKNKPNSNNSNMNNKPMSEKMANIFLWKETAFQIQKQTANRTEEAQRLSAPAALPEEASLVPMAHTWALTASRVWLLLVPKGTCTHHRQTER